MPPFDSDFLNPYIYRMLIPSLEKLPKVFGQYPEIQAVYLFGSRATGRVHRESDLDLGVLQDGDSLPARKLDILAKLAEEGFCNVDLVFLPKDDIVLKYEAIRMNRIVYQRPDFDSGSTFSLVVRQYLDFLPYLEVQRKALKERLLHDKT
jgi:predicted nucleotidyltransferase